ncbi:amidohydrolase family protein [Photobacterium rosenbergii]|uniref:amidohydrolase family protein n=1 Tax=Photobacterium rosenbergii TaxID=294936 RepID=UPI001C99F30A|nr:amidohydrolase family protein [Photobacterium rosenbergii]MBY5946717.1 amidohydrolase family protein [Photobacterium rosenbergii]
MKKIVYGGTVVTECGCSKASIVIDNGKIEKVIYDEFIDIDKFIGEKINVTGLHIFPGLIDAHMHVQAPFQGITGDLTFYQQSICAAYGGVTTFADFSNTSSGCSVLQSVRERLDEMSESSVDFFVHGKLIDPSDETIKEIPELVAMGIPSFKMFMTYSREKVMTSDSALYQILKLAKKSKCLPMVHAESDTIANFNFDQNIKNNNLSWRAFANSKPINCEYEAFQKAVLMAVEAESPLLIVHTTNKQCLDYAKYYQELGYPIFVETCPHYLTLFDDLYDTNDGHLAMCSPPLRTRKDCEDLWTGISEGTISVTGSDDCTFTREEKEKQLTRDCHGQLIQNFTKVVNGISGLEIRLPILLTEGFHKRGISLEKISTITSTNIARVMGLFPQKGSICIGADADLTFVDINEQWTISADNLHNKAGYSLHEGYVARGKIKSTMLRGEFILKGGNFCGSKGNGRFIKRTIGEA